jgi:hypothetical protein
MRPTTAAALARPAGLDQRALQLSLGLIASIMRHICLHTQTPQQELDNTHEDKGCPTLACGGWFQTKVQHRR